MHNSSDWSLSFRLSHKNPICISPLSHLTLLTSNTWTVSGEEYRSWRSSLCNTYSVLFII
jgi:hypothetical protein